MVIIMRKAGDYMKFNQFSFFQRLLINVIMLLALAGFFKNGLYIENFTTGILAALVLGILNGILRPFLQLISLPLTLLTFGLFGFVINAVILWLTSWIVGAGFQFASFGWALLISIIMSVINAILSSYLVRNNK